MNENRQHKNIRKKSEEYTTTTKTGVDCDLLAGTFFVCTKQNATQT
jgi:hypothetical protein